MLVGFDVCCDCGGGDGCCFFEVEVCVMDGCESVVYDVFYCVGVVFEIG